MPRTFLPEDTVMPDPPARGRPILSRRLALGGLGLSVIAIGTALLLSVRMPPPVATAVPALFVPDAGLGTPIAHSGLVVTLHADGLAEGAVPVGVDVRDATGTPVSSATVILTAASLDMRMDDVVEVANAGAPGRYEATLDLDMAGRWQVTAQMTLPGGMTALFTTLLTLATGTT
jgi:hypothetical protein